MTQFSTSARCRKKSTHEVWASQCNFFIYTTWDEHDWLHCYYDTHEARTIMRTAMEHVLISGNAGVSADWWVLSSSRCCHFSIQPCLILTGFQRFCCINVLLRDLYKKAGIGDFQEIPQPETLKIGSSKPKQLEPFGVSRVGIPKEIGGDGTPFWRRFKALKKDSFYYII